MTLSEPQLAAVLATLARTTALAATAPVIGDQGISMRARLVFVVAVSLAVGMQRAPVELAELPLVACLELATGLLVGATARFVMSCVAIAGQLMGLSLGLGFAAQYDVHAGESASTLRTLAVTIASLEFVAAGGLEAIVRSVGTAPAGAGELASLGSELVRAGTAAFQHGLALAAPIVLASFAGNIGLAVMNRAAPAVNVFSIALSAVLIAGGLVLLASAAHLVGGATPAARAAIDVFAS